MDARPSPSFVTHCLLQPALAAVGRTWSVSARRTGPRVGALGVFRGLGSRGHSRAGHRMLAAGRSEEGATEPAALAQKGTSASLGGLRARGVAWSRPSGAAP